MLCMTDTDYIGYIVSSLQLAETCMDEEFPARVALLWGMMGPLSACDPELRYLLTRLQAIKLLMGCYARQIDRRDSYAERHSRSDDTSRSDGYSQATSTMSSVGFSDAVGANRYRDIANGYSYNAVDSHDWAQARNRGGSSFDDIGSGRSRTDAAGIGRSRDHRAGYDHTRSDAANLHDGARHGCNYSFTQNRTMGTGLTIVVASGSYTGTKHTSDTWVEDTTRSADNAESRTDGYRVSKARGSNYSRSQRTSSSYFNALADGHDWSSSQSHGESHSTTIRDAAAHADGLGTSNQQAKDKSEMASRGDNIAHDESHAKSYAVRTSYAIMDDAKAHQRFEHLRMLYDNTQALIDIKRLAMRRAGRIVFGEILTCSMDGLCRMPLSASCSPLPH